MATFNGKYATDINFSQVANRATKVATLDNVDFSIKIIRDD